uniref:GG17323 n=1 Tax=Drosophila erecta TaxID=7220 RepID=B3P4Q1_DROER
MRTEAAVSCFLLALHSVCCQSGSEESWMDPYPAWSNLANDFHQPGGSCQCPARPELSPAAMEDAVALTYFKKFVNQLFQRKHLRYDAQSAVHKRALIFSMLPSQLDELEKVQDARDMDILLTKILESAEEGPLFNKRFGYSYVPSGFFSLSMDIFKDVIELTKTTEELDIDRMIEIAKHHLESEKSWFSRVGSYIFQATPNNKKIEMLKQSSKRHTSICMPDEVLLLYMNNLFIKQLEIAIEKVSEIMTKLSSWATLLHKPAPLGTPTIHQSINAQEPIEDRISGDNLKMLLNVIGVRSDSRESLLRLPIVSGVQELDEAHESPSTGKENLDVSDSSKKSESSVAEEEGFTLVDDHEDNNIDNV